MRDSIEPRDEIYVKGYGFLSFAKKLEKILVINIAKSFLIVLKRNQEEHTMLIA